VVRRVAPVRARWLGRCGVGGAVSVEFVVERCGAHHACNDDPTPPNVTRGRVGSSRVTVGLGIPRRRRPDGLLRRRLVRAVGHRDPRAVGIAPTALYRLFASKDDVIAAYVERPPRGPSGVVPHDARSRRRGSARARAGAVRRAEHDAPAGGLPGLPVPHGADRVPGRDAGQSLAGGPAETVGPRPVRRTGRGLGVRRPRSFGGIKGPASNARSLVETLI
jgi:hypothetical protein